MKWIKYQVLQSVIDGQPVLANKKVGYNEAHLVIAQNEAYNGQYSIVEDETPEPPAGIVPTNLSDAVNSTSGVNDGVAATPKAVKTAYDKANHSHPYLPISGGTMTGPIHITGGNPDLGTIILGANGQIIETDSGGNYCVLGRYSGAFLVGAPVFPLWFRGTASRPTYNGANMALQSDLNRSTAVNADDTNYTTLMARGTSLNNAETIPVVNGAIAWQYE